MTTQLQLPIKPLPVSETHFLQDYKPPLERLPPISTCRSESTHSLLNSTTTDPPHKSSSPPPQDENEDSGPDYYTSNSDSDADTVSSLSPKKQAKRERLKNERDRIKPSYYYGEKELELEALEKGIKPPKRKRKGCRGVPVFEPSMELFQDFYSYIEKIDRWGMRSGIVKIIPPKEWSDQLPNLGQESLRTDGQGQMLRNAKIKSPINQVIQGSRGLFRVMNVAKRRNYNALEWYDLANSAEHRPPDFSNKTHKTLDPSCHFDPNHLDFLSTRTTRSSRRSTSNIAPISHKAQNSRRRVSKPHSTTVDPTTTTQPTTVDPTTTTTQTAATIDSTATNQPTALDATATTQTTTVDPTTTTQNSPLKQHLQEHTLNPPPASQSPHQPCQNPQANCPPASPAHLDSNQCSSLQHDCSITLNNESYPDIKIDAALNNENHPDVKTDAAFKNETHPDTKTDAAPDNESHPDSKPDAEKNTSPGEDLKGARPNTPEARTSDVITDQPKEISSHVEPPNESPMVENGTPEEKDKKKPRRAPPSQPTPEEWATFVERYDKLPYGASKSDYTFQVCRDIEHEYWRTIGNGGEPMYGADTMGSLFDDRTKHWNVANLDNLLNRLKLKKKIPGVNTPYLYFGTWRATFAWHVEDADLYSINYIHFGAPKFWYSIPQEHNQRFENFMGSSFAKERRNCAQFLRHKAFLASPSVLNSVGVQLNKVIHYPGEIILTYPYGYHSGFNLGYNCAESVNFANESWIEKGKKAQFCKCIDDSVTINVDAWLQEHAELCRKEEELRDRAAQKLTRQQQLEQRKRQKEEPPDGEGAAPKKKKKRDNPKPEKLEGDATKQSLTDPSLLNHPTAPTSTAKPAKKPRTKKKPEAAADGQISDKKQENKTEKNLKRDSTAVDSAIPGASNTQRASNMKIKNSAASQKVFFPCALCPDLSEEGLLRIVEETPPMHNNPLQDGGVADSSHPVAEADPSSNQMNCEVYLPSEPPKVAQPQSRPKPIKRAHKVCCMFTPSTWIEKLPTGEEVIKGFEAIEKARWGLKCQLCKEKMGTKVQCKKSEKCAKACHVTCGLKTGIFLLDARFVKGDLSHSLLDPSPEGPPPGLDMGQDPELVVLCKQHNPHHQRAEAERKAKELANKVAKFNPGETLKVKTPKGIFLVYFNSRDELRRTLRVTFEDGHSDVLPYYRVYFGPADPGLNNRPKKNDNITGLNQSNAQVDTKNGSSGLTNPIGSSMPFYYMQASTSKDQAPIIDEEAIDPMIQTIDATSSALMSAASTSMNRGQVNNHDTIDPSIDTSTILSHENDTRSNSNLLNQTRTNNYDNNNFFMQDEVQVEMNNNPNMDLTSLLLLADLSTVDHLTSNNNNNNNNNIHSPSFLHPSVPFNNNSDPSSLSSVQKGLIDSRLL